ncbi:DUF4238 domain-containing protein [Pseudomonas aeruginosa]|nr:DUF4238 domain-containing protein [Pseudomonas aeruginosa]
MATNKNQHFVPRCYLRPFTKDSENQAISLFNIDRETFIQNAPVKNQCSRDYFYGKDEKLEAAIQFLESRYALTLREVLSGSRKITDAHKSIIQKFWLFQHLRTEAASLRSVAMANEFSKGLGIEQSFRVEISEAVQAAMNTFAKNMEAISDLKVCLIKNNTSTPFITSDDPAILTNRWYIQNTKRTPFFFGVPSCGTLAILPLSPEILFIGYDGDVYSIPKNTDGWATIRNDDDADAFNQHQYLNCRANIFIKDPAHHPRIEESYHRTKTNRPEHRHKINYAILDKEVGQHKYYVVVDAKTARTHGEAIAHSMTIHPKPRNWPGVLQWRNKGKVYTNGTGAGYIRKAFINSSTNPPFRKEPSFQKYKT